MNQDRLPRVLLLYRVMIPSIRLCGHMQMQTLADAGRVEYRHCSIRQMWNQNLSWPDIVLLGRLDTPAELYIARTLKKMGKYLIYILDDDLLNVPDHISSAKHYGTQAVKESIAQIIRISDAILSPSPKIFEKYAHAHTRRMLTEEPAVNPAPFAAHDPDASVTIGFAGSIDRVSDVENVLREALESIHAEYGERVRFSFFGAIPSFAQNLKAEIIPYEDGYDAYRRRLNVAGWDIGLAPMIDSPFHRYKHYNKFCEYAAAGIVGIFSRHEPYVRLEKNIGIGCFCENSTQAWYGAIKQLMDDSQLREALREQACRYAHEHLTIEHIAQRLLQEHDEVFAYRAPEMKKSVYMRLIMVRQVAARFYILWQEHRWGAFLHIIGAIGRRFKAMMAHRKS